MKTAIRNSLYLPVQISASANIAKSNRTQPQIETLDTQQSYMLSPPHTIKCSSQGSQGASAPLAVQERERHIRYHMEESVEPQQDANGLWDAEEELVVLQDLVSRGHRLALESCLQSRCLQRGICNNLQPGEPMSTTR